jgi:type I restriction enzyme M protein
VANNTTLEQRLWEVADSLRANSGLKASEYSTPVLGLIFLKFADQKYTQVEREILAESPASGRYTPGPDAYKRRGALDLPPEARFSYLLGLKASDNIGAIINKAMRDIEMRNPELVDTLPKTAYSELENEHLIALLKNFAAIPLDIEGDFFGKIYEYFLGKFALKEGQHGGEFFTPITLVKLIVEVIEPFHGLLLDPACGSGGMFVQSAQFVKHRQGNPSEAVMLYGQEKTLETVRLCKINLAVNGLSGEVRNANSYYDYESVKEHWGQFDFVMANPPFNVDGVDKERARNDARYPFGLPRVDNGNYLWIQMFYSALNERGRAGFVMPNSASDARASEQEIRQKIIEQQVVDVMISIGSNFFYTVTLPCTLWFFDRGKRHSERREQVLFIDARHIFQQIDRAHREFSAADIEFIANIVRLYRDEPRDFSNGSGPRLDPLFPGGTYQDIPGLCKVASIAEIREQGWSLNPGRYVGVAASDAEEIDFKAHLEELNEELEKLNAEAHELEERISSNIALLLEDQV